VLLAAGEAAAGAGERRALRTAGTAAPARNPATITTIASGTTANVAAPERS
jgi:hypothetical protein